MRVCVCVCHTIVTSPSDTFQITHKSAAKQCFVNSVVQSFGVRTLPLEINLAPLEIWGRLVLGQTHHPPQKSIKSSISSLSQQAIYPTPLITPWQDFMFSNLSYFISFHLLPHGLAGHSCTAPFFPLLLFYFIPFATTWSCPLAPFLAGRLRHCSGWVAAAPTAPRTKVPTKQAIFHLILLLAFLFIFTHPNHSFPPATVLMLTLSLTHSLTLSLCLFSLYLSFFLFHPHAEQMNESLPKISPSMVQTLEESTLSVPLD